jgi:hypothetical protein
MFNLRAKPARPPTREKSLKRLEFEMALEIGGTGRPIMHRLRDAASAAGGDLLFVLPAASGNGETAVVRFAEADGDRLVQVRTWQETYAISEEPDMDPEVVSFARASIDVLERLKSDRQVLEPLKTATY